MLTYIQSEIGQSRCNISCPDSSGCNGSFTEVQLRLIPEKDLVDKLLRMQQEKYVRDAGVDDVVECPFCDYKAVCPPVEIDFEFRCANQDCAIVSCRKCQEKTHIPLTCHQFAKTKTKDAALEHRHKIEEAMTKALVRNCNRCKKAFIKDYGCNKMTCPSCGNMQCYTCSKDIVNYNHFGRNACPLNDNVEERHEKDVRAAEEAARAQVQAENPGVAVEHLDFQVSERVKQDEQAAEERRRRYVNGAIPHLHPQVIAGLFPGEPPDIRQMRAAVAGNPMDDLLALLGPGPHLGVQPFTMQADQQPGQDRHEPAPDLINPDAMRHQQAYRHHFNRHPHAAAPLQPALEDADALRAQREVLNRLRQANADAANVARVDQQDEQAERVERRLRHNLNFNARLLEMRRNAQMEMNRARALEDARAREREIAFENGEAIRVQRRDLLRDGIVDRITEHQIQRMNALRRQLEAAAAPAVLNNRPQLHPAGKPPTPPNRVYRRAV